jgi:hypothetical protein
LRIRVREDFAVNDIVTVLKGMDFRKVLHVSGFTIVNILGH